jgi:hypothetical protein
LVWEIQRPRLCLAAQRERHAEETAPLRKRVAELEAEVGKRATEIAELRQATGSLTREIARERAMRRLMQSRRSNRPFEQKVAAELARGRAERASANLAAQGANS